MRDPETVREIRQHRTDRRYRGSVTLAGGIEPADDQGPGGAGRPPGAGGGAVGGGPAVIRELGAVMLADRIVVHASKCLEPESGQTLSQIVREETAIRKLGVL